MKFFRRDKELQPKKGSEVSRLVGWVDTPTEEEVLDEIIVYSIRTVLASYVLVYIAVQLFSEQLKVFMIE